MTAACATKSLTQRFATAPLALSRRHPRAPRVPWPMRAGARRTRRSSSPTAKLWRGSKVDRRRARAHSATARSSPTRCAARAACPAAAPGASARARPEGCLRAQRNASMVSHINVRVKSREPFRPFAPSCLAPHAHEFFEGMAGPRPAPSPSRDPRRALPIQRRARPRIARRPPP